MHPYLVVINSQVHMQVYITENVFDCVIWFPLHFADPLMTSCTVVSCLKLLQLFYTDQNIVTVFWLIQNI